VRWAAVALVGACVAGCGKDDPTPVESKPPVVASDAAGSRPARRPAEDEWRIPLAHVSRDAVELSWRTADGGDQVAVRVPVEGFACAPIVAALAAEVDRQWPRPSRTVRPTRSKQMVVAADADAPNPVVFRLMDCLRGPTGGRDLYPDVTLMPN